MWAAREPSIHNRKQSVKQNNESFTLAEGPWVGKTTPDINNSKRFLRGGTVGEAFSTEEDAIQEHHHEHTHIYYDQHGDELEDFDENDPDKLSAYKTLKDFVRTTASTSHGTIVSGDKVTPARIADETRPKNIKVVYLMKCWHM